MKQDRPLSASAQYRRLKAIRHNHVKRALKALADPKALPEGAARDYLRNFMTALVMGHSPKLAELTEIGRILAVLDRIDKTEKALAKIVTKYPEAVGGAEADETVLTTHE